MSALIQKSPRSAEDPGTAVCAVLVIDSGSYQAFEDKHAWDACRAINRRGVHDLKFT